MGLGMIGLRIGFDVPLTQAGGKTAARAGQERGIADPVQDLKE
jgi:hypothetical protein